MFKKKKKDLDSAYYQIREKWIQRTTDRLASQIRKEIPVTDLNFHYHDDVIVYTSNGKNVFSRANSEERRVDNVDTKRI